MKPNWNDKGTICIGWKLDNCDIDFLIFGHGQVRYFQNSKSPNETKILLKTFKNIKNKSKKLKIGWESIVLYNEILLNVIKFHEVSLNFIKCHKILSSTAND